MNTTHTHSRPSEPSATNNGLFPRTRPSLLQRAASESTEVSRKALDELCDIYWFPLYALARGRGCSPEDAEDYTQGFLARFLAREDFDSVDLTKGRLRSFLGVCMGNYVKDQFRKRQREIHGGKVQVVSIDQLEVEARYAQLPVDHLTPEMIFERQWAVTLLQRVMDQLRTEYEKKGKSDQFETLRELIPKYSREQPVDRIAEQLKLTEGTVRVYAHRLRERYGKLLREEIYHTIPDPAEIQAEIDYLLGLFS